jgi:uncharacterized protein (TIGR03083 family)
VPDVVPVVDQLVEVWASLVEACERLPAGSWEQATDCPGWSVQDQLSHLVGIERMILGEPTPEQSTETPVYVGNDIGRMNEAWVDSRRATGPEVLAEFVEVTNRRIDTLRSTSADQFDQVAASPLGQLHLRDFLVTRVIDTWAHEQDVRRAVGRPGGRNGSGEQATIDRCEEMMPYVVGKRVAPPDGTLVRFHVTGLLGRRFSIVVRGGRAELEASEAQPTAELTMDQEAFWLLGLGRASASAPSLAGRIEMEGDEGVGGGVLAAMAFMP